MVACTMRLPTERIVRRLLRPFRLGLLLARSRPTLRDTPVSGRALLQARFEGRDSPELVGQPVGRVSEV